MDKPILVVIVGPTAVGKTALSIELAKFLDSIIISADSRQFFKEMEIGTAKPSKEQLSAVPHYFVNQLSVADFYSVGDFEREVISFLDHHYQKHRLAFLVGGSGLYVNAVVNGLDEMPTVPEALRWEIMEQVAQFGLVRLLEELKTVDPSYYNEVDKDNTQRVVRAIEVYRHTGLPFSSFWKHGPKERPFRIVKVGITADRNVLYRTINNRVDEMMVQGLLEEAKALYPQRESYALRTVGYQEFFDHFEGKLSLNEAVELVKRNTRRFAKRQLTWFRRDPDIQWFQNTELEAIKGYLRDQIAH